MKQAILAIILLGIFGLLLSGGFTLKDPKGLLSSRDVGKVEDGNPSAGEKNLQIKNRPVTLVPPTAGCTNKKVAVDFLLDVSSSMCLPDVHEDLATNSVICNSTLTQQARIEQLKRAMITFADRLTTDNVVGIQAYSSPNKKTCSNLGVSGAACEVLPIGTFDKNQFIQSIASLQADGNTAMKSAFVYTKPLIEVKKPNYQDYQWYLIFLSDGVPVDENGHSPGTQHPFTPTDVVTPIKDLGVTVISIGLGSGQTDYDPALMTQIATSPDYFHPSTGADLENVFQQIAAQTCTPSVPIDFSASTLDWEDVTAILDKHNLLTSLTPSCLNELRQATKAEVGNEIGEITPPAPGSRVALCWHSRKCVEDGYSAYDGITPLPQEAPTAPCQEELKSLFQHVTVPALPNTPPDSTSPIVVYYDVFNNNNTNCDYSDIICKPHAYFCSIMQANPQYYGDFLSECP